MQPKGHGAGQVLRDDGIGAAAEEKTKLVNKRWAPNLLFRRENTFWAARADAEQTHLAGLPAAGGCGGNQGSGAGTNPGMLSRPGDTGLARSSPWE